MFIVGEWVISYFLEQWGLKLQCRNSRQRRYLKKNNEVGRWNIEMVDNVAIQRTMKFDVAI